MTATLSNAVIWPLYDAKFTAVRRIKWIHVSTLPHYDTFKGQTQVSPARQLRY